MDFICVILGAPPEPVRAYLAKFGKKLTDQLTQEMKVVCLYPLVLLILNLWTMAYEFRPIAIAVTGGYLQHLILLCMVGIPEIPVLLKSRSDSTNLKDVNFPALIADFLVAFPCVVLSFLFDSTKIPTEVAYSSESGYRMLIEDTSALYIGVALLLEQSFWIANYRMFYRILRDYYILKTYGPTWLRELY